MANKHELIAQGADILVVDDEIASLRLLTEILTREGYQVRPAEGPQVALKSALAHPPSLILLDVKMPEMSGFEVCQRLKQDERTRDVPIIFVSALQDVHDRVQGFEVGGVDFVSKPLEESEVLARVKTHLQLRNIQLHLEELVAERTAELTETNETLQTEIADRKQAVEALKESEEKFRTLVTKTEQIVYMIAKDGTFLLSEGKGLSKLGLKPGEVVGKSVLELYDNYPDMLDSMRKAFNGETSTIEVNVDGNHFRNWYTPHRDHEGGIIGLMGLSVNITEQKQAEEDLRSILKASQNIAGETELDRLMGLLMTIVMESAGAQRGYLILEQGGQWMIVAQAQVDRMEPQVIEAESIAESDLLAQGIVHYVARTQQTVVLEDASHSGAFVTDPYVQRHQVKSLLCTPLVNQGKTSAVLYLENNLAPHVFSPQSVDLLNLLSSQMAVSIDNARIHARLEKLLEERSRALSSAEDQIRTLFESAQVGIGLTTLEGEFLSVNKGLLHITGYTEAEIMQRNVTEFYADPEQRIQLLERLEDSRAVHDFGIGILRKDGTVFYASLNVSMLTREGETVLLTVIEDVSRIVEAEKSLEESENLLRVVADNYPAFLSIITKDEQDLVVGFTSGREFKKLNLDPDAFVGQTLEEVFGDQASIVRENYMRAFMGEDVSFELFINGQNQLYHAFPITPENGERERILVVVENIDERKLLEAQHVEAAARAERDRLARELHDSVTQSLFTTTLFAQAGRKGVESGDLDGAAHHLTRILETAHQALKEMRLLIYELLPEQLVHLGLVEAIQERLNAVEKRTGTKVSLTAGELGDLPDPVNKALYRITQEALNNSLKHAQADVVTVTIHRQGQRLCLEIGDDGQGFDLLEAHGGGGLGLISMRERTEQLGGEFSIDTARQQGTKISVVLEVSG